MKLSDTAQLLAKIQLGDNRDLDELVIREWHDTLGFLRLDDALEAVRRHRQTSTAYLMPAHVIAGARAVATERAEEAQHRQIHAPLPSAPRPANFDAMTAAWNDPDRLAVEHAAYAAQLAGGAR